MSSAQIADTLTRTQLFGELSREVLEELANKFVERSFKKGQLVFHQGDPGDALFVVAEGLLKVFVTSEEADEMVLATLRPPEVFGELALVDGGPRSATAEAMEPVTLLVLTRTAFFEQLRAHPLITDSVFKMMATVLRRLTGHTADLVFLDLHGRVAKLLLALGEDEGQKIGEDIGLDLHLTQTDLAGMVGGSRQSVNQILRSFERRGYLELQGRKIVLKNPELLRRRAGL